MNAPSGSAGLQALVPWIVIVAFLFSMVWLQIRPDPFSFGTDEGFNLMKTFLMARASGCSLISGATSPRFCLAAARDICHPGRLGNHRSPHNFAVRRTAAARGARSFTGQHWKWEMLAVLHARTTQSTTMITDDPLIAFRAGIPVDPHLAVFATKRRLSGLLSESTVEERLRATRADFVLFSGQTLQGLPGLTEVLAQHYLPLRQAGRLQLHERIPIP
jgi:hypothetical protein